VTLDSAQDGALHNKSNIFCRSLHYHFLKAEFPCVSRTRAKAQVILPSSHALANRPVKPTLGVSMAKVSCMRRRREPKYHLDDGTGGPNVESNLRRVRFGLLQLENIPPSGKKKGALH
jgi:hypothetical protein